MVEVIREEKRAAGPLPGPYQGKGDPERRRNFCGLNAD